MKFPPVLRHNALYLPILALALKQWTLIRALNVSPGPWFALVMPLSLAAVTIWTRRLQPRSQLIALFLANAVITFVVIADLLHLRAYGDFAAIAGLRYIKQLGAVSDSLPALFRPGDGWLVVDLPVLFALIFTPSRTRASIANQLETRTILRWMFGAIAFITIIGLTDPTRTYQHLGHVYLAKRLGPLTYHFVEAGSYFWRRGLSTAPTADETAQLKSTLTARKASWGPPGPLFASTKGRNLIVIQVESLQSFALNLRVGDVGVTPNLNRLAQESLQFTEFYEETGSAKTADADLLVNCGLHPLRQGAVYYEYGDGTYRGLPRVLSDHGYTTAAFQAIDAGFWNLFAVYPNVGFSRFDALSSFELDQKVGLGLGDASFLRQSAPRVTALKEPFYAFLVTLSSHVPYDYVGIPKVLDPGPFAGQRAAAYLNALHYTDAAIGEFLQQLRVDGVLDRSLVAVYGDHAGLELGRGPAMQHYSGVAPDDEAGWRRIERRVPFLLRFPGGANAGLEARLAGELDVAPTVLGLLGVEEDTPLMLGRDALRDGGTRSAIFPDGSAIGDGRLFIPSLPGELDGRCYDTATKQPIEHSLCTLLASAASDQLRLSREIVSRDLLKPLVAPTTAAK